MNRNRILIISHALELGGAERSLIGMLWALSNLDLQVDLFLLRHEGELLRMIPPNVSLLPEIPAYTVLSRPMTRIVKEGHIILAAARLFAKWKAMKYVREHQLGENGVGLEYSHKYTYRLMPPIQPNVEYDAVISYLTPHYIAGYKVNAKKKISWIHTDYMSMAVDRDSEYRMWKLFDNIAAVSDSVKDSFSSVFPELEDRVSVVENILAKDLIFAQANEKAVFPRKDSLKLLSIGRFSYAKNFDNVPYICKSIRETGLDVVWYLIGFGPDETLIRSKIHEAGMEEHVIILGKKDNPYPYIKSCDLYVQPSRYEGKCVAVREAQILGKPVVITNFTTSASQLENGVDGVIVPLDNDGCAQGIVRLLADHEKMERLAYNCGMGEYTNTEEIEKVFRLLTEY